MSRIILFDYSNAPIYGKKPKWVSVTCCASYDTITTLSSQEKDISTTEFLYDNLVSTVMNLFLGGTETTSSTIRYALSVLIKHPNIQGRSPNEDTVILFCE